MANKGKRETKKQVTEVKQELQKELDKMGRVHSNIPTQQVEESGATHRKSTVPPASNASLTGGKISSNIVDNDNRKSSTSSIGKGNQPTQTKSKPKSSISIKVPSVKEDEDEEKKKGRPKGAKDKQPRKRKPKENNGTTEKRKGNYKGRPKGAKDKQPRKKRDFIKEAQDKLEIRREELNNIPETTEEIKDKIEAQDQETRDRFESDNKYAQSFHIGELIEQQIIDMCNEARTYQFTSKARISWVENKLQESKQRFGADAFYNNLWNKQGDILEHCQIIVWSSENQDVSFNENKLYILLFDIPFNELEA